MGAMLEGYADASKREAEKIAERHRQEGLIDQELHDLGNLLDQDAAFLKVNEITHDIVQRSMRIAYKRSPVATIHYAIEAGAYVTTIMRDGSHVTAKTTEDCAKAVGEMLFAIMPRK